MISASKTLYPNKIMVHWNVSINYTVYCQLSEPSWHLTITINVQCKAKYWCIFANQQFRMTFCTFQCLWRFKRPLRPWIARCCCVVVRTYVVKKHSKTFLLAEDLTFNIIKKTTKAANRQALQVPTSGLYFFFVLFIKIDGLAFKRLH